MCQFQQLYSSEQSYVVRCNECRQYQLFFNRTVISLTEAQLQAFIRVVDACKEDTEALDELRDVVVPTPCKGVHMVLTSHQVTELAHMLETADAECKTLSLLHLFQ